MEKSCEHSSAFIFNWIFFILAGNQDMHERLDEFEFRQDPNRNYRVNCPWASEKSIYNVVNTLASSFLSVSSSFLQVTRTIIKPGLSSKLSIIGRYTEELATLELLKISPQTYNGRNIVTNLAPSFLIGFLHSCMNQ